LNAAPPGGATLQATNTFAGDTDGSAVAGATFNDGLVTVQAGPPTLAFEVNSATVISGSTVDFGSAALSGSTSRTIRVLNTGGAGSFINNIVPSITSGATDYSIDNNGCAAASLEGPSDFCDIVIEFAPSAIGTRTGGLSIATSASNGTFSLTGIGTAGPAPDLAISPTSWTVSGAPFVSAGTEVFTITNNGAGSQASFASTGSLAAGQGFEITANTCTGQTLQNTDSCDITVEFTPPAAGEFAETLVANFTDEINDGTVSVQAALDGTGNGSIFNSDPAPGAISLGVTTPVQSLGPLTVDITNSGNAALEVTCEAPTGDTDQFTFTGLPIADIPADGASSFSVSCDVPEQATYTASLVCTTNEPSATQTRVSYTYDFSCSARPLVVPTMQNWGLILMALMMMLVGGLSIRFFRT
jgi:hypothetical protein